MRPRRRPGLTPALGGSTPGGRAGRSSPGPLRERARAGRADRGRDVHRRRRHQADHRRRRPLRHGRHRLRRDERERPRVRGSRADRAGRLRRGGAGRRGDARGVGEGLREGASQAAVEIPGGELAQVPEMLRGHPPRGGWIWWAPQSVSSQRDQIVTGERSRRATRDRGPVERLALQRLLARASGAARAAAGFRSQTLRPSWGARGRGAAGAHGDLRARRARPAAFRSSGPGLAHITGDGLLNLLRLNSDVGYQSTHRSNRNRSSG